MQKSLLKGDVYHSYDFEQVKNFVLDMKNIAMVYKTKIEKQITFDSVMKAPNQKGRSKLSRSFTTCSEEGKHYLITKEETCLIRWPKSYFQVYIQKQIDRRYQQKITKM